ncbi:Glycoside hydrolase [Parasponia andersonii]|uniref:Glycoside hydrolase n=1 Tax=Parasponia andersonii TaxID=3476 RepID=A0A2P5CXK6_PARAD|nr:Glycoside hydrolase [Parasponia andersonii]
MTRSSISFNFVTKNCGLPLVDLVSLCGDELASELSWNSGEEHPTNRTLVLERRLKQTCDFLLSFYLVSKLIEAKAKRPSSEKKVLRERNIEWHENDESPPKLEPRKFLALSLRADEGKVGNQIHS